MLKILSKRTTVGIEMTDARLNIAYAGGPAYRRLLKGVSSFSIEGAGDDAVSGHIRDFIARNRIRDPDVYLAVHCGSVINNYIEVPSVDHIEIAQMVNLHPHRNTPYQRSEVIAGYISSGRIRTGYTRIVQFVVKREFIDRCVRILGKAGFEPSKLFLSAEATGRLYARQFSRPHPVAVLNVNYESTEFIVLLGLDILFVRNFPVGRQRFMHDGQRALEVFAGECARSCELYRSQLSSAPVLREVVVTEDMGRWENFKGAVEGAFGMQVSFVPYERYVPWDAAARRVPDDGSGGNYIAAAAGALFPESLAVDFSPDELKARWEIKKKAREIWGVGVYVMLCLMLAAGIPLTQLFFKELFAGYLNDEIKRTSPEAASVEKRLSRIKDAADYSRARGLPLGFLEAIIPCVPSDVRCQEMTFQRDGECQVSGIARASSTVFDFVQTIEASRVFKDARIKSTSSREEGASVVVDFRISFSMEAGQ